jgi:hypothetical protein
MRCQVSPGYIGRMVNFAVERVYVVYTVDLLDERREY